MKVSAKIKMQYYAAVLLGWMNGHKYNIRILTYHSIYEHTNKGVHLSPKLFEKHLEYLSESGYKSFKVCDVVNEWPAILDKFPAVIITFDDGLYNNYEIAFPLLKKYNMTATFFVPTSYISDDRKPSNAEEMGPYKDMPMMSWQDLRDMVDEGFEIGAHSHHHVMVGQQTYENAMAEIATPITTLEQKLNTPIRSFAYPKGRSCSFALWTRELLVKSGYRAGCTMLEGRLCKNTDVMALPRINIMGDDDIKKFKMKLEGYYDCLKYLRQLHRFAF